MKHLEKFRKSLNASNTISVRKANNNNSENEMCVITINSKKMVEDLYRCNITPKKTMTLKPFKFNDKDFERHYWRGAIDGDGSIFKLNDKKHNWSIMLTSASPDFIDGFVQFIYKEIGVLSPIHTRKTKNATNYMVYFRGSNLPKKVVTLLYKDANIYLDRKYEKAINVMNLQPKRASRFDIDIEVAKEKYKEFGTWTLVAEYFGISKAVMSRIYKQYIKD